MQRTTRVEWVGMVAGAFLLIPGVVLAAGENQQQIPAEVSPQNPTGFGGEEDSVPESGETIVGESSTEQDETEVKKLLNINYFGIFFGPSIQNPSSYQTGQSGKPDPTRPVILKNFLNVGHDISDQVTVTGTAFWVAQPVMNKSVELQDPFVRVSYNSIYYNKGFNIYGDLRGHFPVTSVSRENDLKFGLQTFQALTYGIPESRYLLGLYASERKNIYGTQGFGTDLELYFATNLNYQINPRLAATFYFEVQRNHDYRSSYKGFYNDGTDFEPGLSWEVTQNLMVNPYLHVLVGPPLSLRTTSLGMMLNWVLL